MKQYNNVDLSNYSSMRLTSKGDTFYQPENFDELIELIKELRTNRQDFYIVAKGSNIIFAEHVVKPIISVMSLNSTLTCDNGVIECGCSVTTQKLIRFAQEHELGGIEYLFSLPASMGGCIYMNAGRGKKQNQSIVDYLQEVTYLNLETLTIQTDVVDKSKYSYRTSPYQSKKCIILSAKLALKHQTKEETEQQIKNRIALCNKIQDASKPSCGSVFREGNRFIFHLFKLLGLHSGDACFSKKTPNWISNVGQATATDVRNLIKKMIFVHKLFGVRYKVEIKYFD